MEGNPNMFKRENFGELTCCFLKCGIRMFLFFRQCTIGGQDWWFTRFIILSTFLVKNLSFLHGLL